jgi:putative ABC transport system permease protein
MIQFLLKGLLRDRHRSLLPLIIVTLGVMLTVIFHSWISGIIGDSIEFNARFSAGHVKVTTLAYADNSDQMPNDLAIQGTDTLLSLLKTDFPDYEWAERIHFAGLIDVPDQTRETHAQGAAIGFAIDLLSENSNEPDRMNITNNLVQGKLPQKSGEILLSDKLASKLEIQPGDTVSLIGSTMYGEMAFYDFVLSGTVTFGTTALDNGTIVADITDVRTALNMENASGEILGYLNLGYYDDDAAKQTVASFNSRFHDSNDEFSPLMKSLKQQNSLGMLVDFAAKLLAIMIVVFLAAMSIILWNLLVFTGLWH